MRIQIPEFGSKNELHNYLRRNKKSLISQKKSLPIYSEPSFFSPQIVHSKFESFKNNDPVLEDVDSIRVKVVANSANWVDSHMDMIVDGAPARSIRERKNLIPHLHDHLHLMTAEVGDVQDIYLADISLTELGLDMKGATECVIMVSDVKKSMNEKVFNRYKDGKVKQHSIGLQYVRLELAIDDSESEKEYSFFKDYYDKAINKDKIDEYGFFWVVQEYKLIENSAVLFGSNELTPTLDNNLKMGFVPGSPQTSAIEPLTNTRKMDALTEVLRKFNKI